MRVLSRWFFFACCFLGFGLALSPSYASASTQILVRFAQADSQLQFEVAIPSKSYQALLERKGEVYLRFWVQDGSGWEKRDVVRLNGAKWARALTRKQICEDKKYGIHMVAVQIGVKINGWWYSPKNKRWQKQFISYLQTKQAYRCGPSPSAWPSGGTGIVKAKKPAIRLEHLPLLPGAKRPIPRARLIRPAGSLLIVPNPKTKVEGVRYIRIHVQRAMLWPVRHTGRCWDPCLGKRYRLPARDQNPTAFHKYFKHVEFNKVCTGTTAPDGLVEIKIGKYEKFTTTKMNNSCSPEWKNTSHVFRVSPNDSFSISVYDNDGMAGFQAKRDLMGTYTAPRVPNQLLRGGYLLLRRFGQVEALILRAEIVKKPRRRGCRGAYQVRIVEVEVEKTKPTGGSWDRGFGFMTKPDVIASFSSKQQELKTPKLGNAFSSKYTNTSASFFFRRGQGVRLKVIDKDPGGHDLIGEKSIGNICRLIRKGGIHTFSFGRVKKLVVIFEKK